MRLALWQVCVHRSVHSDLTWPRELCDIAAATLSLKHGLNTHSILQKSCSYGGLVCDEMALSVIASRCSVYTGKFDGTHQTLENPSIQLLSVGGLVFQTNTTVNDTVTLNFKRVVSGNERILEARGRRNACARCHELFLSMRVLR